MDHSDYIRKLILIDQSSGNAGYFRDRLPNTFTADPSQSWLDPLPLFRSEEHTSSAANHHTPKSLDHGGRIYKEADDVVEQRVQLSTPKLSSAEDLSRFVEDHVSESVIYFIRQRHSFSRLSITEELFEALVAQYDVFSQFRDVAACFGIRSGDSEIGIPRIKFRFSGAETNAAYYQSRHSFGRLALHSDNGTPWLTAAECAYILRFVELNRRDENRPWSIRQTGVYHHYSFDLKRSTMILLRVSNLTEKRMGEYARTSHCEVDANPFDLHILLLDSVLSNWKAYMVHIDGQIREQADRAVLADINGDGVQITQLAERQFLKQVEDRIIDIGIILAATVDTVTILTEQYLEYVAYISDQPDFRQKSDAVLIYLNECKKDMNLYQMHIGALRSKVEGASQLVSSILDLESGNALKTLAEESREENATMRTLTKRATQDAASVKVLTVLTMIYLPATVVSNFFSTQFVKQTQDPSSRTTVDVTSDWWMFLVVSIPLTMLTLYIWRVYVQMQTSGQYPAWCKYLTSKLALLFSPRWNKLWRRNYRLRTAAASETQFALQ